MTQEADDKYTIKEREDILGQFYLALVSGKSLKSLHIPHSDVFYVREAIFRATGKLYSLAHVEEAMHLENIPFSDTTEVTP